MFHRTARAAAVALPPRRRCCPAARAPADVEGQAGAFTDLQPEETALVS